jgi:predicted Holliday junction resolvase-like endonuclease
MFEDPFTNFLLITATIALIAFAVVYAKLSSAVRLSHTYENSIKQLNSSVQDLNSQLADTRATVPLQAHELYAAWQQREVVAIRTVERESARLDAVNQLAQWRMENELEIRADAIRRSQSVILGKVTEHIVPYMPDFPFNAKDVRFIGSPIDLVVFDGMADGDLQQIIFVEVKTGPSATLSKREREIRSAITAGKVRWLEIKVPRALSSDNVQTLNVETGNSQQENLRLNRDSANGLDGQTSKEELDREFNELVDKVRDISRKKN